jgi:hypothetical protein
MPCDEKKQSAHSYVALILNSAAAHVFQPQKEQTSLFWLRNAKQRHTVGFSTEETTLRRTFNQVRKDLLMRLVSRRSVHNISLARSHRSRAANGVGGRHTIKAAASSNFTLAQAGANPFDRVRPRSNSHTKKKSPV